MPFLVDTCVISELYKKAPDAHVRRAVDSQKAEDLYVSVMSLAEIRRGILLLSVGQRRRELEQWTEVTENGYRDRILSVDLQIAKTWAERAASAHLRGRQIGLADGLIAATAIRYGLTVMTRNVRDFEPTGVALMNPWLPTPG